MIRTNLHHLLSQAASAAPQNAALSSGPDTISYGELWSAVLTAAAQLQELDLRRGDRVAIYLEKRVELVVAMFAASAAGGIFVPVNHVLKAQQLGHILRDSGARFLVTSADRLGRLSATLAEASVEQVVLVGAGDAAESEEVAESGEAAGYRVAPIAARYTRLLAMLLALIGMLLFVAGALVAVRSFA